MSWVIRAFFGIFDPKIGFYVVKYQVCSSWYPELLWHHSKNGCYCQTLSWQEVVSDSLALLLGLWTAWAKAGQLLWSGQSPIEYRGTFVCSFFRLSLSSFVSPPLPHQAWTWAREAYSMPLEALFRPWKSWIWPWEAWFWPWEAWSRPWEAWDRPWEASSSFGRPEPEIRPFRAWQRPSRALVRAPRS